MVAGDPSACGTIRFVTRSWLWWAILSTLGLVSVLLPDSGRRLVSLSQAHGPSLIDSLGVLVLLAGWAMLDIATLRRRRRLLFRREVLMLMATAGIAAVALVLWSVSGDHGAWWIVGAVMLAAIQLTAAVRATFVDRSIARR
jgi:hypothetical protein